MSTKQLFLAKLTMFIGAVFFSLVLATPALAESTTKTRGMVNRPTSTPSAGVVRACQAREEAVKKRLSQLTALVKNMLIVFDRHAVRVETFYTNTLVPMGKTLPNYDALVADIAAKRKDVDTALAQAKAGSDAFACTSGDPKQLLTQYRVDMQGTKNALKAYRTSIKNLIVAVSGLTPEESPKPSPSPSPTPTPTPSPEE